MAERYHTVPPIILPKPCQTIHYSLFTIHSAKLSATCAINHHVPHRRILYHRLVEGILLVRHIDILEEEIHQTILLRLTHIEEILRLHIDIPDIDIVTLRQRHILTVLGFEELRPRPHHEERTALTFASGP